MLNDEKREIEVITGDGNDLNISPVYEHIKSDDIPKNTKKKKNIVIPKRNPKKQE